MIRYIPDPNDLSLLMDCFTGLYPLDQSPRGKEAFEMVLRNPEKFVMKPQREGGGNNIYGTDIPPFISKLSADERNSYILMDIIQVVPHDDIMVKANVASKNTVISELGIYGVWLRYFTLAITCSSGDKVLHNRQAGFLVRTKTVGTNEGGVATGYSVLDSPLLV
jgi:glutathione synthase